MAIHQKEKRSPIQIEHIIFKLSYRKRRIIEFLFKWCPVCIMELETVVLNW
jgi:hypothetical protein